MVRLAEASFALLMINMKDFLHILRVDGQRISFTDDVPDGRDVTDLITDMRNAICHIGSADRHFAPGSTLSFGRMSGQGILVKMGDLELGNPYQDDVAFFYGKHRVFLKRHAHRATQEANALIGAKFYSEGWPMPF